MVEASESYSYVWKFESKIMNSFGEIPSPKKFEVYCILFYFYVISLLFIFKFQKISLSKQDNVQNLSSDLKMSFTAWE